MLELPFVVSPSNHESAGRGKEKETAPLARQTFVLVLGDSDPSEMVRRVFTTRYLKRRK